MPQASPGPASLVGSGPEGLADLTLAVRHGRTCLTRSQTSPPLVVQRALYLDESLPDMAFVYLCNPTAGVFQGDRLKVRVRLCPGARVHLTTQAATKIHAMPEGSACQDAHLHLEEGAYLEYLPGHLIPYRGARFTQTTSVTIAPGATLVYSEILAPGRAARGESLAYTRLQSRLTVNSLDASPLYHEAFTIAPGDRSPLSRGILGQIPLPPFREGESGGISLSQRGVRGDFPLTKGGTGGPGDGPHMAPALGTLLIVSTALDSEVIRAGLRELPDGVKVGVSGLPGGSGVALKVLAWDVSTVQATLRLAWSAARQRILGAAAPAPRRY